jgi:hypothetical protein
MRLQSLVLVPTLLCLISATSRGKEPSSEIYTRRVLPLLRSPAGSSCKECHFSGIELSDFLGEREADTFSNLRAGGWIDVKHPAHSKLLTFIRRHGKQTSPEIKKLRHNEIDALTAWIKSASSDPELLAKKAPPNIGIELDESLIRHLRRDHVLSRFLDNIWTEMGRCINCHSPERNQKQVEEHGEQMSWIVPRDPEATLKYLHKSGLIDLDDPDESEIRTKPTELVEHGGGPKFPIGSDSDKRFLAFLRDYAKVVAGDYSASRQLPKPSLERSRATANILRLTNLPEAWSGKLLRVDLYAATDIGWSKARVATADSPVNGEQRIWQGIMRTVSPRDADPRARLRPGRYLARISLDRDERMKHDPDALLTETDFVGTIEFEGAWKLGWREPKIVDARQLKHD